MEGKKNGDTEAEQMQCSLMRVSRENKPKGNLQDHSTRYPWTELILTGEIQSPVGRCRYSDAKWFSEQEKKKPVCESSLQGTR